MIRPKTARRERLWLEAVEQLFFTPQEIATAAGLSVRRVQYGLKRAREERVDLQTIWDIEWRTTPNPFVRSSQCELHDFKDIPKGLEIGCLACLKTGLEHLIRHPTPPEREHGVLQPPPKQEPQAEFAERMHGKTK